LGTDKRNPVFSIYRQTCASGQKASGLLHVFYGAELLEVVPDQPGHHAFKLLIGWLYNAGVNAAALQRSFGMDRKTMQRWGRALLSDKPEALMRALAGRSGARKLTTEIKAFVTMRFAAIYAQSRAGYSQRLRAEIKQVFDVELSGECLRPLLKQLKAQLRDETGEAAMPADVLSGVVIASGQTEPAQKQNSPSALVENRATTCDCGSRVPLDLTDKQGYPPGRFAVADQRCRKHLKLRHYCHHLGVLLFSRSIGLEIFLKRAGCSSNGWHAFCGIHNSEQTSCSILMIWTLCWVARYSAFSLNESR
jgi:hypothetical protein